MDWYLLLGAKLLIGVSSNYDVARFIFIEQFDKLDLEIYVKAVLFLQGEIRLLDFVTRAFMNKILMSFEPPQELFYNLLRFLRLLRLSLKIVDEILRNIFSLLYFLLEILEWISTYCIFVAHF